MGYDPESFWDQTPRTLRLVVEGYHDAERNRQNERAWMAWHIAAWQRAKRMPSYGRVLLRKPTPAQPWQAQQAIMEAWANARNKRLEREAHHG